MFEDLLTAKKKGFIPASFRAENYKFQLELGS